MGEIDIVNLALCLKCKMLCILNTECQIRPVDLANVRSTLPFFLAG